MRRQTLSLSLVLFLTLVAFSFLPNAPAGQANGLTGAALTPAEGVSGRLQSGLFTVLGTSKVIGSLINWPTVLSPPIVSIWSPANNATFTPGSNVQLSVVAYDTDGTISQVQIYRGTTLLGQATPIGDDLFYYSWNNVAAGSYSLTAKATDNLGAITTSAAVTVISNVVPTVSIASPSNGYVLSAGTNLAISVNAADPGGTVSSVLIYRNSIFLGAGTLGGGTYNYSWNAVPAGTYSLVARVEDNYGAWANSAPISVISNVVPTVSVTSPANNFVFTPGTNLPISVTAGDADGTISQVQIYRGATLLGAATPALGGVYNYSWNNLAVGSHALTARATDNRGAITTSTAITINSNTAPTVSVTSPANNFVFTPGGMIQISANAADSDGTVSKVEFFQGTVKLGEDTSAPYSYSWSNVPAGIHGLSARATDNGGAITNSSVVSITGNQPPVVTLTSPTNNADFGAGSTVALSANASDSNGTVSKVEFFRNTLKLGEDTTAPYTCLWNSFPGGAYQLTARATDNGGAITTSAVVNVTVTVPVVTVVATDPSASEPGTDKGTFTFTRVNTSSSLQVFYSVGGTAMADGFNGDDDYQFTGSATMAAGASSCTLTVSPLDNPAVESPETVILTVTSTLLYSAGTPSSATVTIYDNDSFPPSVSLTSPANLSVHSLGTPITINANASDSDGTVTKVEFYDLAVKIGEDTSAPYSFTWSNFPLGNHFLTARATDNTGGVGVSGLIQITAVPTGVARLDPANQTGGGGENPLSRNYNWNVPLVSLPGRSGLDLGLSLSYNSLVWTRSGSIISFDDDRGFPSPGFRLGFPAIQSIYFNSEVGKWAYLLITPNGSRVELRQVGASALYEAADSSHLLLDTSTNPMVLRTTDGTQLSYELKGTDFECTKIKDRNGNYITVNYTAFNRIDTVVDTLSRTIKFNYDLTTYLNSITQTWTVNGQALTHTWASFHYNPSLEIQTNFGVLVPVGPQNSSTIKVLNNVTLDDNSAHTFDYTSWGQIWKINHYAADGHLLNYRAYNLPGDTITEMTDCPRFTERHDWAENFNRGGSLGASGLPSGPEEEVLTGTWSLPVSASWTLPDGITNETGVVVQMTQADGTYEKIYFAGTAGTATGWKRGLPSMVETYGKTTPGQPTAIKQRSGVSTWTQDNENASFLLNPRVKETHVYDFDGSGQMKNHQRTRTTFVSINLGDGTSCHLPQDLYEYQANATTVLRRTHTDYHPLTSEYISRRVIGLPSESRMFEVDPNNGAETLMSRVAFAYDESGSIQGTDAPIRHDNTNYSSSFVTGRGNLSSVKRFDVVTGQSTLSSAKYNTAGSPRKSTDALGHEVNIGYADSFSDGLNNRNTLAYPTSVTDADGFTATSQYNFDFGLITRSQTPPPAGHSVGPIKHFTYDSKTRLEKVAIEINGNADYSHTRLVYPDSQNRVDTYTTIETGAGEALEFKLFDGHGRSLAIASAHPVTGGSAFAGKLMLYDKLGRTIKESNPTETNASGSYLQWPATGDDSLANGGSGWVYTNQTYDWNSRPLSMTNPDGTIKTASYDGCGCAGGDTVTFSNEGTLADGVSKRSQQKVYRDMLGRTARTETYNWDGGGPNGTNGSIYSTTVNTYNARDQITRSRKFQGAAPADPNAGSCLSESLRIGTDDSWKHTLNVGAGWQNPGFDDSSWSDSVDEGPHNTSPWGFGGFQPDTPAHWIWHRESRFSGDNATVYFRKGFIATSSAATLTIRADNVYTAYLNGVQVATGNQWQLTNVVNLALTPGTTYVLAVEVVNQGGPGGLIAEVNSLGTSCEQGLMGYDGYGRLKTRHVPGQDLNAATTYNYSDDNTVTSIVDGRGATTTYSHNNRHLVTGITYDVPFGSGIADSGNVTYGYDAASNRTSMTDGMGSMSYQYDQLSRVSSETRNIADPTSPFLSASYQLNYAYNLANQPKKITDHTNSTIAYNYDQVGRITSITGENNLYAGVSTYASSATYRAWGALKGVTYGSNYTSAIKYNSRLQGTEFEVSGRPAQFGPSTVMKTQFDYYADTALKFAHDTLDERFDRAYSYDNAGRLKEAYTGSEARDYINGTNSGTQTGPYRQSYQYDVYDHITQRSNRFWSQSDSFNASYANNRRQDPAFEYDAEGHLTKDSDLHYTYDAAGRSINTFDSLGAGGRSSALVYDGDGRQLKKRISQSNQTTVTYYVRSSVLGGRVITELSGQGVKQKGFVFGGSQEIARQENNVVVWQHVNPLTGSSGDSFANGNYIITNEPDPMGVNVGTEDPLAGLPMDGFEPTPERPMIFSLGEPGGCGFNPNCTTCTLDGFEIGCDRAMHLVDVGAADILVTLSNGTRVPASAPGGCPLGVCRVWVPGERTERDHPPGPDDDVVRVFRDETHGRWDTFSFGFVPQGTQGPAGPQTQQEPAAAPFDWSLFWDLVNVAVALQRESCRSLFPGDADPMGLLAILASGDTTFGSITRGDLGAPQGGLVDAAVTRGITGSKLFLPSRVGATPIVQSAWVGANITINNNAQAPGQAGYRDYLGVGASDAVYRGITLIHELGHVASIIYGTDASRVLYDAGNPAQSRANSQLVYDNCFK